MSEPLSDILFVRVSSAFAAEFKRRAEEYGSISHVHRELIEAFVEKRLSIKPNPSKPSMEKLYEI